MNVFDVWANLMSLGAIDFGIIVDGAVIIVESAVFLIASQLYKKKKLNSKERDGIASNASKKMMNAAFFGQLRHMRLATLRAKQLRAIASIAEHVEDLVHLCNIFAHCDTLLRIFCVLL